MKKDKKERKSLTDGKQNFYKLTLGDSGMTYSKIIKKEVPHTFTGNKTLTVFPANDKRKA